MSKEDKNAVLLAAKKLKKTKHKIDDMEQIENAKTFKNENDDDDEGIVGKIINAVSNLKKKD